MVLVSTLVGTRHRATVPDGAMLVGTLAIEQQCQDGAMLFIPGVLNGKMGKQQDTLLWRTFCGRCIGIIALSEWLVIKSAGISFCHAHV